MDDQLQALLDNYPGAFSATENGKVQCDLNGHCMPARHDAVSAFVSGAKFKKLYKKKEDSDYLSKLEPFLMQSVNYEDKLYCALTCQLLNRTAEAARLHMQGKRFKKAKERFMDDEQELLEEPLLEEGEGGEEEEEAGDSRDDKDHGPGPRVDAMQQGQQQGPGGAGKRGEAAAAASLRKGEDGDEDMDVGFWAPADALMDEGDGEGEQEGKDGAGVRHQHKQRKKQQQHANGKKKKQEQQQQQRKASAPALPSEGKAGGVALPAKKAKLGKPPKMKRARMA